MLVTWPEKYVSLQSICSAVWTSQSFLNTQAALPNSIANKSTWTSASGQPKKKIYGQNIFMILENETMSKCDAHDVKCKREKNIMKDKY
ncbi:hypothetical protein BaRGS_00002943 [Batillaria attramentaria]|uniref:Uncharacterized protein n=1 Tax=Batillaria attramentaria TaxID=370345 RepID=A0ABD0M233_9CAEN